MERAQVAHADEVSELEQARSNPNPNLNPHPHPHPNPNLTLALTRHRRPGGALQARVPQLCRAHVPEHGPQGEG